MSARRPGDALQRCVLGALLALPALLALSAPARAQTPLSRADAVSAALQRGARLALATADTAVAFAQLLTARAWQNPTLAADYTRDPPNYHYALEIPLDLPFQRGARIGSARAARAASQYRFVYERAAAALDADTTYTRALASRAHAQLSRRNAQAADSLLRIANTRREAGDASDLDVELASVNAGQAANIAAADSLTYLSTVLDLQAVIGLAAERVAVTPTDSLVAPAAGAADTTLPSAATPLQVAAAEAALESARLAVQFQRRGLFASLSISAGFETGGDPSAPRTLPTFGIALPVPLLNFNRGPVAQARAERARAQAELTLAQALSRADIARARRTLAIVLAKVERDRSLVVSADRVAAMSLTAYREGASSLPNVLEAQRNARDVLGQYVDDVAAAWIASAQLRVLTISVSDTH